MDKINSTIINVDFGKTSNVDYIANRPGTAIPGHAKIMSNEFTQKGSY